jgi:8-oxo-dGTP pyrophosphatase MutT (NUDIX family)
MKSSKDQAGASQSQSSRASNRRPAPSMKQVVAALIFKDNLVLACQRTKHQTMPLKWEFPGGKIEEGEQPRDALRRELE